MLQLFSVSSGMRYEPGAEWTRPVGDPPEPEAEEDAQPIERRSARSLMPRRRARAGAGRYQADNPATTTQDEAWEQEPAADGEPEPAAEPVVAEPAQPADAEDGEA